MASPWQRNSTLCVILALTILLSALYFRSLFHSLFYGMFSEDLSSTNCLEYSPAYPSAGGAGCSPKCTSDGSTHNSSYGAIYSNTTHKWPEDLKQNMHLAGEILKKYGPLKSLNTERSIYLHVSHDYYCCYTPEEALKIGEFVNTYQWNPQQVRFDRLVCAIHSTGDMVSLVLMLDEVSQTRMLKYALDSEAEFERTTGLKKHIPHTKLQGFHMTLATVNQSLFPVRPAVEEINRVIPPGMWHSDPVVLHKPVCHKCEKLRKKY